MSPLEVLKGTLRARIAAEEIVTAYKNYPRIHMLAAQLAAIEALEARYAELEQDRERLAAQLEDSRKRDLCIHSAVWICSGIAPLDFWTQMSGSSKKEVLFRAEVGDTVYCVKADKVAKALTARKEGA